ncbi:MAG: DUF3025 domain-containing protein, partial [Betaproteobacteria bacterium]
VFGHALYHKALNPFIGMTGKAVLLKVPHALLHRPLPAQVAEADRLLAGYVWDRAHLTHGRELWPLPVLGVPGWWDANEQQSFYDNTAYFRPGRRNPGGAADQAVSSSL